MEWTPRAVLLMKLARDESRAIGDEYVGTQHLLLAAVAVSPLEGSSFDRPNLLNAIRQLIGFRDRDTVMLSPGGQTPRAKLTIQRAEERAHNELRAVTPEDLWFGLLSDPDSDASKVLGQMGVSSTELRETVGGETQPK